MAWRAPRATSLAHPPLHTCTTFATLAARSPPLPARGEVCLGLLQPSDKRQNLLWKPF